MKIAGDRVFAFIVATLLVAGIAIFLSASLGLLAREEVSVARLALSQIVLGIAPGVVALFILRFMNPRLLARLVLPFYVLALLATALVFVPGLGLTLNGATRWLDLGFASVQPAEFLKIGTVLLLAAYLAQAGRDIRAYTRGLLPFVLITGIPIALLLLQPNTSTALIIAGTGTTLYVLAGAPRRDFAILGIVVVLGAGLLLAERPYLQKRFMTFLDPSENPLSSGYQIQQSLIAIGSGEVFGKGFGQSIQKFNYLPEPVGDSVFAVVAEELGFVGASILILLFVAFAARGLAIAADAANAFGAFAATGLTLVIALSAFLNIGAMLGVLPLTGLPLPFISHGGSALLAALASVGIILNVAAHRKRP